MRRRQLVGKIMKRAGRYRAFLALSLLLSAGTSLASLYIPVLAGRAIDHVLGPGQVDFAAAGRILPEIALLAAGTAAAQWLRDACNSRAAYGVVRDIRREAFEKLEILPLKFLDSRPKGEIANRIAADADQFADGLLMGFSQLFSGAITILGTFFYMAWADPRIALVVALLTPLSLLTANFIAKRTFSMFTLQSSIRGEQAAFLNEIVENQKTVKAYSREREAREEFDEINGRLQKASLRAVFYSSLTNPCTRFVNSLVYAGVGLFGALLAIRGQITVGQLTCFLSYANQFAKPFNEISGVVAELQNALACAERVFALIEEEPQEPEPEGAAELMGVEGNVDLEQVCFSYVPEKKLIEGFCLSVKPGQRVAIVGPTGCGKTTIINLLMRFYEADSGSIKVEGKNIREVTRGSLRGSYGMVLQETWLRAGTVRENILLGKSDASEEEMIAAAKAAHAHSFIRRLPKGYDTVIGEEGGSLSAGQKQLLCIARAMLCLPPMLILDEATSSIDMLTEQKVQDAFARMMEGRTCFLVAHRLPTIRDADVILVMRDGKVVEQGRHEELISRGGFYRELYQSQFEP